MVSGPKHLTHQIGLRLDPELLALVDADARANGRTRAQTVRHYCRLAMFHPTHEGD